MPFSRAIGGSWIAGTDIFQVSMPPVYYSPRFKREFSCPFGAETDFSSIPRVAWTILGVTPTSHQVRRAGVIHDHLYKTGELSRADSDQLFYDMVRAEGLGYIRGQLCFQALRAFGGVNYRKGLNDA